MKSACVIPPSSRDGTPIGSRPATPIPQGESRAGFANRVERGLERMLALWTPRGDSEADDALLVAHRGVIRAIVRRLTGREPIVELGSIQILRFDGGWHAEMLDLIDHLGGS